MSGSVISDLRWDLRAIFQLALEDGTVERNPATSLVTPAAASRRAAPVMKPEEVVKVLSALDVRERLARLAIFAGMRPGVILVTFRLKIRFYGGR